jgi:hypothetical protein
MSNENLKSALESLGFNGLAEMIALPLFGAISHSISDRFGIDIMSPDLVSAIAGNKDAMQMLHSFNDAINSSPSKIAGNILPIVSKSAVVPILAFTVIGAFIVVCIMILSGHSKVDGAIGGSIIGYISAKAEQIISYYFGNSSSSHEKDIMLANSTPNGIMSTKPGIAEKIRGKVK